MKITQKTKLTKYNKDNILGWSEADFEEVIYDLMQCNFLSINNQSAVLNCMYLNCVDDVHSRRLGL